MTVEIVIAVAMVAVMIFKKGSRKRPFDKDRRYRNKDNKNPATLQAKRKQDLLFVTKETIEKAIHTVNRFYIRRPDSKRRW